MLTSKDKAPPKKLVEEVLVEVFAHFSTGLQELHASAEVELVDSVCPAMFSTPAWENQEGVPDEVRQSIAKLSPGMQPNMALEHRIIQMSIAAPPHRQRELPVIHGVEIVATPWTTERVVIAVRETFHRVLLQLNTDSDYEVCRENWRMLLVGFPHAAVTECVKEGVDEGHPMDPNQVSRGDLEYWNHRIHDLVFDSAQISVN